MHIVLNGEARDLGLLHDSSSLQELVDLLSLKADQVAIEQNGTIVRRAEWSARAVRDGDRFEIVQFVGGGS